MKMNKLFYLLLLFPVFSFAQGQMLLTSTQNGHKITIDEKDRVLVTVFGHHYKGKIHFLDEKTFMVNKNTFRLEDVAAISKRSYAGSMAAGAATAVGVVTGNVPLNRNNQEMCRNGEWLFRIYK